ncbi:response regulator transcription factor [Maribacter sp. 2304DJ31-5]|uniref:response regulator transcription factor n=1 Tax=Maribacter sp. 2304DJ31-5 TaxID=3386273 RepID=UPI0039BC2FF8
MKKTIVIFGLLILALLLLLQISTYSLINGNITIELTIAMVAIVFFFAGIYLHKKSLYNKELPTEAIDLKKVKELELSKREYEVLKEIALGLSNKEIAQKLFLTESTIKTHVSNLLVKLNAKRRTQAVQIAKELHII